MTLVSGLAASGGGEAGRCAGSPMRKWIGDGWGRGPSSHGVTGSWDTESATGTSKLQKFCAHPFAQQETINVGTDVVVSTPL